MGKQINMPKHLMDRNPEMDDAQVQPEDRYVKLSEVIEVVDRIADDIAEIHKKLRVSNVVNKVLLKYIQFDKDVQNTIDILVGYAEIVHRHGEHINAVEFQKLVDGAVDLGIDKGLVLDVLCGELYDFIE